MDKHQRFLCLSTEYIYCTYLRSGPYCRMLSFSLTYTTDQAITYVRRPLPLKSTLEEICSFPTTPDFGLPTTVKNTIILGTVVLKIEGWPWSHNIMPIIVPQHYAHYSRQIHFQHASKHHFDSIG